MWNKSTCTTQIDYIILTTDIYVINIEHTISWKISKFNIKLSQTKIVLVQVNYTTYP